MSLSPIFSSLASFAQAEELRFLLMTGDQIYADDFETNGIHKVATTLDDYRAVYQHIWSHPDLRAVLSKLPAFMMMDDHEVDDDWRWLDFDRTWATIPWWDMVVRFFKRRPLMERRIPAKKVQDALQAYWEHQGMHSPRMVLPPGLNADGQYALAETDPGSLAYSFEFGAAAFFVLDTRSMRVRGPRGRSMLGPGQWLALEAWLLDVKDDYPVKFIVSSSSVFFRMAVDIPLDRWSGFPEERNRLLSFIANSQRPPAKAGGL